MKLGSDRYSRVFNILSNMDLEFNIQTTLNIDSDHGIFCELSRSTIWALLFNSVATLLAIAFDRYLSILFIYIPVAVILGIWLNSCCFFFCIIFLLEEDYINKFVLQVPRCHCKFSLADCLFCLLTSYFVINSQYLHEEGDMVIYSCSDSCAI